LNNRLREERGRSKRAHATDARSRWAPQKMVAAGRCLNGKHYGEPSVDGSRKRERPEETPAAFFMYAALPVGPRLSFRYGRRRGCARRRWTCRTASTGRSSGSRSVRSGLELLTGSAGGRVLFGSVFGNPADLIRVAALSVSGTPNVLGAPGDSWVRFLCGDPCPPPISGRSGPAGLRSGRRTARSVDS
jgi:hypothetical protein